EALKTDTNYSDELIFTLLAAAYTQKNDFDSAILYHQKALSKRKDYSSYILLAVLLEQKDRTDEAKQTYRDAISFAPKRPEAYGSLGALELKSGNIKGAIELLEKSAALNDRLGVVQGDLAIAYAQNGEREKALNALENAEKLKTDGIEAFRARVLSALGEGPALTAVPSPSAR
ncbi:MAG: tetratricopeptide repeat protein, partial [Spirochaetaceae bacterium]|nr:tetratricopeptide repeat protein [Spirochaetaceae bacterium]